MLLIRLQMIANAQRLIQSLIIRLHQNVFHLIKKIQQPSAISVRHVQVLVDRIHVDVVVRHQSLHQHRPPILPDRHHHRQLSNEQQHGQHCHQQ